MSNFIVLRRTQAEIKAFGGDVYIDIDGKNAGIIRTQNLQFDLSIGTHTIKMYKSHTMGTFIGIAETIIEVSDGEKLYARYSAPLIVNQPGNIIISQYNSEQELDSIINDIEKSVHTDFTEQQIKIENTRKESEKNNTALIIWIIVIPIVIGTIWWVWWGIAMSHIW